MRAGTYSVFERRFGPIETDGNLLRDDIPPGTDWRLVWTMIETNNKWYLSPGWHVVNRLGYVLCERPFTDETREYLYD